MVTRYSGSEQIRGRSAGNNLGAVAKWYGRGLQILYPRFESGRRLSLLPEALSGPIGTEVAECCQFLEFSKAVS